MTGEAGGSHLPGSFTREQEDFIKAVRHWADTGEWVSQPRPPQPFRDYGPERPCGACGGPVYWEFRYGHAHRRRDADGRPHDCPVIKVAVQTEQAEYITPGEATRLSDLPERQAQPATKKRQPLSVEVLKINGRANTA